MQKGRIIKSCENHRTPCEMQQFEIIISCLWLSLCLGDRYKGVKRNLHLCWLQSDCVFCVCLFNPQARLVFPFAPKHSLQNKQNEHNLYLKFLKFVKSEKAKVIFPLRGFVKSEMNQLRLSSLCSHWRTL